MFTMYQENRQQDVQFVTVQDWFVIMQANMTQEASVLARAATELVNKMI